MSYPAITLHELAATYYADLLRHASEQRSCHTAAGTGRKTSWLLCIFDAAAEFLDQQRVTVTRSRRRLWPLHA